MVVRITMSLAIGRRSKVRLAAKLSGWKIDIISESKYNEQFEHQEGQIDEDEPVDDEPVNDSTDSAIDDGADSIDDGTSDNIGERPINNEHAQGE